MYLLKSITKIIWEHIHRKPYGIEAYLDISKIVCPNYFTKTEPKDWKVKKYFKRYFRNQYLDEPLTVKVKSYNNENHVILVNGYIRYLIMRNIIQTYCETYDCTYDSVPDSLKCVPIRYYEKKVK